MRQISFAIVLALVGCAQTSRDHATQSPEKIDADIDATTVDKPPADANVSRVYIDEKILSACGLDLPQAFFEFESAKLDSDDQHELTQVAECLDTGALQNTKVGVVGHADPRGTEQYNDALGMERARSVSEYLKRHGVEGDRLQLGSAGEEMASANPDDWPANRRVDVILRSVPN
jgi:outer membrane protein OmpA-like peptidoglycan-associated protein